MQGKKLVLKNIVSSILLQFTNIISGFILPRIILSAFGSEVNGLVSSLTQFLGYISLLEGGVTGVVTASMYEPLVRNDQQGISQAVKTANVFFRKIALLFVLYTAVLSCVYPLAVDTEFTFEYICSLVWVMSISLFVQYFFSLSLKLLLSADKKVYIVCTTQIVIVVLNTAATVAVSKICADIHLIRLCYSCLFCLQPLVFHHYTKKFYRIDKNVEPAPALIAQRWNGFGINIAAFVHNNTDIVILTMLGSLADVSVYSVYLLVVNGLKSLILSVSNAMFPHIGQAYAQGDLEKLRDKFRKYEFVMLYITYVAYIVGGLCVTPFVQIYTRNVHDADYNRPVFGWLLIIAEMIFCIREPYVELAYAANRFKDFTKVAYLEASINIILSVVLVIKYGIVGVAAGTLVSMGYRTVMQIRYLNKHILYKRLDRLFRNAACLAAAAVIVVLISRKLIAAETLTIADWILFALKNTVCAAAILGVTAFALYRTDGGNRKKGQ